MKKIITTLTIVLSIMFFISCDSVEKIHTLQDNTKTPIGTTGPISNDICNAPLSEYCDTCKNFEEYKAEYVKSTTEQSQGSVGTLTCQTTTGKPVSILWTELGYMSRSPLFFFDKLSGELISMHKFSDCNEFCNFTSFDIWYGTPLETDCNVWLSIKEIPEGCSRPWMRENFEWSAEKCHKFEDK